MTPGRLTFFTGKMGAGKTTRSKTLAAEQNAVWLSEDEWLAALYPGQIRSLDDYLTHAQKLKPQMQQLVKAILRNGTDVVMDFPGNTRRQRAWFRQLAEDVRAPLQLLFIDEPDAVCLQRIAQRAKAQPERAATDTAELFHQMNRFFEAPCEDEGFEVVRE
jgi:predicted kinase